MVESVFGATRRRVVITGILVMSDEVRQIVPEDEEITEEWLRETDEPGIRNVGAFTGPELDGWYVSVWAQELFRQDSLGAELRHRIERALRAVAGVACHRDATMPRISGLAGAIHRSAVWEGMCCRPMRVVAGSGMPVPGDLRRLMRR
jgi:hypothetical protein